MLRHLLHAHSNWSYDGHLDLPAWRSLAGELGCATVLFAEHEESGWSPSRFDEYVAACAAASTASVTLMPGLEFNQDGYHLVCYGLRRWVPRPCGVAALAAAVHEQGCILGLAHPGRYRWTHPSSILDAVDAVEVWNSRVSCDGEVGPHPRTLALVRGRTMLVGQDVHERRHASSLYAVTDDGDVLGALRAGTFRVEHHGRTCRLDALERWYWRGVVQRLRTPAMRAMLRALRVARRCVRVSPGVRAQQVRR